MLLITKLAALGIVIWFYMSAEKNAESPMKWAVIGFIGYVITWFLVDYVLDSAFASLTAKRSSGVFILGQIPAIAGIVVAYFIRAKLISDAKKTT